MLLITSGSDFVSCGSNVGSVEGCEIEKSQEGDFHLNILRRLAHNSTKG